MTGAPLDVLDLLRVLARHQVRYVIIGGIAVQAHGHRRTTQDLDIIPAPDADNIEQLAAALRELEATPRDIPGATTPTAEQLSTAPIVPPLLTRHGEIHVLREAAGAPPFDDLHRRAVTLTIDDVELPIASLDDIIAMKRATGRPTDLADIAALTDR